VAFLDTLGTQPVASDLGPWIRKRVMGKRGEETFRNTRQAVVLIRGGCALELVQLFKQMIYITPNKCFGGQSKVATITDTLVAGLLILFLPM
jgi:hypothetical protein